MDAINRASPYESQDRKRFPFRPPWKWVNSAIELTNKDGGGTVANELLYRDREADLEIVEAGRPWSFDGDGALFRLVSEAQRIHLAHLFDSVLAVGALAVTLLPRRADSYPISFCSPPFIDISGDLRARVDYRGTTRSIVASRVLWHALVTASLGCVVGWHVRV